MLKLTDISFAYNNLPVLKDINFSVNAGKHVALIGKSGSGKSTLLSLIYGNLLPTKGKVTWNGENIFNPATKLVAEHPYVKYLTQEFNVMPYISVAENIVQPLSRMYPEKNQEICNQLLKVVDLEDFANTKVKNLSGGQKQRVALAKVLAKRPQLLLLDEPFSHIDVVQRNQLRRSLFAYLKQENITCIFATHDPDDFLSFADDCLVLHNHSIVDYRPMNEVFEAPKLELTASLLGEVNILSAQLLQVEDQFPEANFLIYPHEITCHKEAAVEVEVLANYFKGSFYLVKAKAHDQALFFNHPSALPENTKVTIEINSPLKQRTINYKSE